MAKETPRKKKSGGGVWIIIIIVILILFYLIGSNSDSSNIVEDQQTYTKQWVEPSGANFTTINKLLIKHQVRGCGEYYIKEVASDEFVIACTSDGKNWTYYIAWPNIDELYGANGEMLSKLTPPY